MEQRRKFVCKKNPMKVLKSIYSLLNFGYSEKATKFEKIFHLEFDATQKRQILCGMFFQILWPSQNIRT